MITGGGNCTSSEVVVVMLGEESDDGGGGAYFSCMIRCMLVQISHSFFSHDSNADTALFQRK